MKKAQSAGGWPASVGTAPAAMPARKKGTSICCAGEPRPANSGPIRPQPSRPRPRWRAASRRGRAAANLAMAAPAGRGGSIARGTWRGSQVTSGGTGVAPAIAKANKNPAAKLIAASSGWRRAKSASNAPRADAERPALARPRASRPRAKIVPSTPPHATRSSEAACLNWTSSSARFSSRGRVPGRGVQGPVLGSGRG